MNINNLRTNLYETDCLKWIETTAKSLKDRDYTRIDWDNLIEEVEDMGRSERRGFESNLTILLIHLYKVALSIRKKKYQLATQHCRTSQTNPKSIEEFAQLTAILRRNHP